MNMEDKLRESSRRELDELKLFLFKENIRLQAQKNDLEETRRRFESEKVQFRDEMNAVKRKNEFEKKRMKEENRFFEKKMKILQNGFVQLQEDRKILQCEVNKFENRKENCRDFAAFVRQTDVSAILFRGVNSHLSLKKRYKDLMKIFHPDNISGDQEIVQMINKEYDEIRQAYETGRQAK